MAWLFDGVNRRGLVNESGGWQADGPAVSVSGWFRPSTWSTTSHGVFIKAFASEEQRIGLFVPYTDRKIRFGAKTGSGHPVQTGSTTLTATTGVWHHIGGRINSTAIQAYYNGADDGSSGHATGGVNDTTAKDACIGPGDDNSYYTNGDVAEVAIWNAYLTNDEFKAIYNGMSPLMIRRPDLLGYWPLHSTDVGSDPCYPDASGNGRHLSRYLSSTQQAPSSRHVSRGRMGFGVW